MSDQLDMFEGMRKIEYQTKRQAPNKRVAEFKRVFGGYITPYVLILEKSENNTPTVTEKHALLSYTEAEKRVTGMCALFGMKRTVLDEGLVASGNGWFLYLLAYVDDTSSKKG